MATYMIEAGDVRMGEYRAESMAEALEKYADDAGFESYDDLVNRYGSASIYRIDSEALTSAVAESLGVAIFQDSYGDGVALVRGESVATYAELAEMAGLDIDKFRG